MDMWVDTNVIIRFLTNDHAEHSEAARRLIAKAYEGKYTLWVHPLVVAECCYVLESSQYDHSREVIADRLISLLNSKGFKMESETILTALGLYAQHNVDFEDAYLSAVVLQRKPHKIVSFNTRDFARCGCECLNPVSIV
jgi:predicted nucleic-acid-binding protein